MCKPFSYGAWTFLEEDRDVTCYLLDRWLMEWGTLSLPWLHDVDVKGVEPPLNRWTLPLVDLTWCISVYLLGILFFRFFFRHSSPLLFLFSIAQTPVLYSYTSFPFNHHKFFSKPLILSSFFSLYPLTFINPFSHSLLLLNSSNYK